MQRCPHCENELGGDGTNVPAICPSCGESLGEPPRRASVAPEANAPEQVLFEGRPAAIASVGEAIVSVLTLGLVGLWLWLRARGTHYKITTHRVVVEQGLFSKRLEQIDLYRVDDYVVDLPFGQRLLGTGNLVIHTTDRTTRGELHLGRLRTDVRKLYEELRAATERDKARRGVRRFDTV